MSAAWVTSSVGLPNEGQPVEFILDGREVAIDGTYVQRTFRSRWSGYDAERVQTWRSSERAVDPDSSVEAEQRHFAILEDALDR